MADRCRRRRRAHHPDPRRHRRRRRRPAPTTCRPTSTRTTSRRSWSTSASSPATASRPTRVPRSFAARSSTPDRRQRSPGVFVWLGVKPRRRRLRSEPLPGSAIDTANRQPACRLRARSRHVIKADCTPRPRSRRAGSLIPPSVAIPSVIRSMRHSPTDSTIVGGPGDQQSRVVGGPRLPCRRRRWRRRSLLGRVPQPAAEVSCHHAFSLERPTRSIVDHQAIDVGRPAQVVRSTTTARSPVGW